MEVVKVKKVICSFACSCIAFLAIVGLASKAYAEVDMIGSGDMQNSIVKVYSLDYTDLIQIVNTDQIDIVLKEKWFYAVTRSEKGDLTLLDDSTYYLAEDGTLVTLGLYMMPEEFELWKNSDFLHQHLIKNGNNAIISEFYLFNQTDYGIEALINTDLGVFFAYRPHNIEYDEDMDTTTYKFGEVEFKTVNEYFHEGAIYVNDAKLKDVDTAIFYSWQKVLFPLRTTLEALGSLVIWDEGTGNIYFDFEGVAYVCKMKALPNAPNFIMICEVEHINSILNSDYIQLNPMSADGVYYTINNRKYLYQMTGQRLLEALGCEVIIDFEQQIIRVNK